MPPVVKLAPVAIGRGGYPSYFCHTCVSVAGIPPKKRQPRFPITNVGNDNDGDRFPIIDVGNDEKERFRFPIFTLARRSAIARKREDKLYGNNGVGLPQP